MTRPADRLDAIEARANAATAGPWEAEGAEVFTVGHGMFGGGVATVYYGAETGGHHPAADRSFIVNARQDVPALVAALRAVLDLTSDVGNTSTGPTFVACYEVRAAITTALGDAS